MFFDEIYLGELHMRYSISFKYMETTIHFWGKALISYGVKLFGMTPFGWKSYKMWIFGTLKLG